MRHAGNRRQAGLYGGSMGTYINAIRKSADNNRIDRSELLNEFFAEVASIGGGIAGADDTQHIPVCEIRVTFDKKHCGGIGTHAQPRGIISVVEKQGTYPVARDKLQLTVSPVEHIGAEDGFGTAWADLRQACQCRFFLPKHLSGRTAMRYQGTHAHRTDTSHQRKGNFIEQIRTRIHLPLHRAKIMACCRTADTGTVLQSTEKTIYFLSKSELS